MLDVRIKTALVCEDARVEISGKHIVIGIYPDDVIVISNFPATVRCALWAVFSPLKLGEHVYPYRLIADGPERLLNTGKLSFTFGSYVGTPMLIKLPFLADGPLTAALQLQDSGEEWHPVGRILVQDEKFTRELAAPAPAV